MKQHTTILEFTQINQRNIKVGGHLQVVQKGKKNNKFDGFIKTKQRQLI